MTKLETSNDGIAWITWEPSAIPETSYFSSVYATWCADLSPYKRLTTMPDEQDVA